MPRRIPLNDNHFYDEKEATDELKRIFDICHGCRRCFNLCGLFPKLFDLMDSQEIDGDISKMTDAHIAELIPDCTLCDMCFMVKCPYVPPHPWNVDLPRSILRYRAIQSSKKKGLKGWIDKRLAHVDQYAPVASACSGVVNAAMGCACLRKIGEPLTGIDQKAPLPHFRRPALEKCWITPEPNPKGHAFGQEVWLYLTCFMNYYVTSTAQDVAEVLAHWGIKVHALYPGCCGMPLWEQGHLNDVVTQAKKVSHALKEAHTIVPLTPSCTFMLKSEWPALCPDDPVIMDLSTKTFDVAEYCLSVVSQSKKPLKINLPKGVSVHMACHVRAQNKGNISHTLLEKLSGDSLPLIDRCSGHGGLWGYKKDHFETAHKIGKPVVMQAQKQEVLQCQEEKEINDGKPQALLVSECPLAAQHLQQEANMLGFKNLRVLHPLSLIHHALKKSSPNDAKK